MLKRVLRRKFASMITPLEQREVLSFDKSIFEAD